METEIGKTVTVRGTFGKLWSLDEKGVGYFTISLTTSFSYGSYVLRTLTCIGHIHSYNKGFPLTITGELKVTENNRIKCYVSSYEEDFSNGNALKDYLSRHCEAVGKGISDSLFKVIGKSNAHEVLSSEERREMIAGRLHINRMRLDTVYEFLNQSLKKYELFRYLYVYGLSDRVDFLYEAFGKDALHEIKDHPYLTLSKANVPFSIMDEIGFCEGVRYDNKERLKALAMSTLKDLTNDGSTYVLLDDVFKRGMDLSKEGFYTEPITKHFLSFALNDANIFSIDAENRRVSFEKIKRCEEDIFHHICRLEATKKALPYKESLLSETEKVLGVTLDTDQKKAFSLLKESGIKILTGGAGVGKTSLVNALIHAYETMYPNHQITLLAPTGMAAKNLTEKTGKEAKTIHRGIQFKPYSGDYEGVKGKVIPLSSDFIIVDEFSMVDTVLASLLLSCIKDGALVLFLGDKNQIDAVGYGMVFRDLITSKALPVYTLKTLHRQDTGSLIHQNAETINQGKDSLTTGKNFSIVPYDTEEELKDAILKGNHDLVLTTTKKGYAGTKEINKWIQKNLTFPSDKELHRYGYVYHISDRIVCTKNDYKIGVVNGDVGVVTDITENEELVVDFSSETITLPKAYIPYIEPAYCITIHKSQGSEYGNVGIVLPEYYPSLLEKSLLYTAVTRGKDKVTLYIKKMGTSTLTQAIHNDRRKERKTALFDLLSDKK